MVSGKIIRHKSPRLDRGAERVAAVGLDDDGRLQVPARMGPGLDGRDRAGHGGVDGDAEALAIADLLADGHAVSDFDERLAGRADVLGHGDGDDARVQRDDGRLTRKLLIALRMDAAEKRTRHSAITSIHVFFVFLYANYSMMHRKLKFKNENSSYSCYCLRSEQ